VEAVLFANPDPRQRLPATSQLISATRVFFLVLEQLEASLQPFFAGADRLGYCFT
jgi:hypothetical protein